SGGGSNTGAIVGAAVGGVVGGLAIIALAIFLYRRRRQYSPAKSTDSSFVNSSIPMPPTQPFSPSPFTPPPPGSTPGQRSDGHGSHPSHSLHSIGYGHGREEMNEIRNAHQLQASSLPYPGSMPPIQPPPPVDTPSTDGAYGRGSMYGTHGHLGGQYPHEGFGGSPYPSRFPEIQGDPTDLALRRTRSPEELRERMREAWGFGPDPASGGAGGGGEGMAGMGALDHDLLRERERESRGSDASERERPEWRRA
ncbi:hypothetical protein BT69DRAFT_1329192, partial [Atractiella rhizophila]